MGFKPQPYTVNCQNPSRKKTKSLNQNDRNWCYFLKEMKLWDYNSYQRPHAKRIWRNKIACLVNYFVDYRSHSSEISINHIVLRRPKVMIISMSHALYQVHLTSVCRNKKKEKVNQTNRKKTSRTDLGSLQGDSESGTSTRQKYSIYLSVTGNSMQVRKKKRWKQGSYL